MISFNIEFYMPGSNGSLSDGENTGQHGAPISRMLRRAWQEESQTEGSGANRQGRLQVSVVKQDVEKFRFHR
jgi:hypothetical protein